MRHPTAHPLCRAAVVVCLGLLPVLAACGQRRPPPPPIAERCPPWPTARTAHQNVSSPYLGCANRMNLQNMLDRPADLVKGRELGPADGNREALAVERYEKGEIGPLESEKPAGQLTFPSTTLGSQ